MKNVLLLGGTGAMGKNLVKIFLKDKDINCIVTTRQNLNSVGNVKYIQGNAHDLSFVKGVLAQEDRIDVIVDFMQYSTCEFLERVELLLSSTVHYFFLSSARVYADSKEPLFENSLRLLEDLGDKEYLDTDEYALTKARQEDILHKSSYKNWTIVRPYITYSSERLQLGVLEKEDWLYRALHGRTVVFSKDIADKVTTLTFGGDVAKCISILLKKQKFGTFHITCNYSLYWQDVLDIYIDTLEKKTGKRMKVVMTDVSENMYYGGKWQLCKDRYYNRIFDNSKIGDITDVSQFMSPQKGLVLCLEQFLLSPKFKKINWIMEGTRDRITHEWTPLSEIIGFSDKIRYLLYRFGLKCIKTL